jgi:hypothetical protein
MVNWTAEDLAGVYRRREQEKQATAPIKTYVKMTREEDPIKTYVKMTREEDRREMNKLEARYWEYLQVKLSQQLIQWCGYECLNFRLADKTYYKPDFVVITNDGDIEVHETKGYWRDDARAKIKVASEQFPWITFRGLQWNKGAWKIEVFKRKRK